MVTRGLEVRAPLHRAYRAIAHALNQLQHVAHTNGARATLDEAKRDLRRSMGAAAQAFVDHVDMEMYELYVEGLRQENERLRAELRRIADEQGYR